MQEQNYDDFSDEIPLLVTSHSNECLRSSSDDEESHFCHESLPDRVAANSAKRQLTLAAALSLLFIVVELIGGYLSNSLAILSDAAHLFTDFASFVISAVAVSISNRYPQKKYNYGFYRTEAVGALLTLVLIWYVTGILMFLSTQRLLVNDFQVESNRMIIVASISVIFNIILGGLLHWGGHSHNPLEKANHEHHLNIRAALIHVIGDLIQSIGIFISSIIIKTWPEYKQADPICTLLFSGIVVCTTVPVFHDTLRILLEGFPTRLDYDVIQRDLRSLPDVTSIHDLRVWCLTVDKTALTVHLSVVSASQVGENTVRQATKMLRSKHSISFVTIQVEDSKSCATNCDGCQELLR